MRKGKYLLLTCLLIFTLCISACDLGIHPDSANSVSAVLAVIGEYLLAIISIVLVFVFHLVRSFAVSFILLGCIGIINNMVLPISPYLFLGIGVLLLVFFFIPVKAYSPKVIIDRNVKKAFENDSKTNTISYKDIFIDLGAGIILLCIEYWFFSR